MMHTPIGDPMDSDLMGVERTFLPVGTCAEGTGKGFGGDVVRTVGVEVGVVEVRLGTTGPVTFVYLLHRCEGWGWKRL